MEIIKLYVINVDGKDIIVINVMLQNILMDTLFNIICVLNVKMCNDNILWCDLNIQWCKIF